MSSFPDLCSRFREEVRLGLVRFPDVQRLSHAVANPHFMTPELATELSENYPQCAFIHNHVAIYYMNNKQYALAIQHYLRTIELFPNYHSLIGLANLHRKFGDLLFQEQRHNAASENWSLARSYYVRAANYTKDQSDALLGIHTTLKRLQSLNSLVHQQVAQKLQCAFDAVRMPPPPVPIRNL
eukprot:JP436709.1.p1 GENE.JP436709.1~~JP436709.1.p1  ORF type:complete len:183 (+),score=31.51 JP436709.1:41-589(+)